MFDCFFFRLLDALANGETDENQDMAATAGSSYPNDNSKWVDVTPDVKRDVADGLSVLPINGQETNEDVALHAMNPTVETAKEFDEKKALQRAKLLSRLRNESHVDLHEDSAPALTNGFSNRVLLEGMRENDDRQDDVFIVELDKDDDGIGLGLIDGLVRILVCSSEMLHCMTKCCVTHGVTLLRFIVIVRVNYPRRKVNARNIGFVLFLW